MSRIQTGQFRDHRCPTCGAAQHAASTARSGDSAATPAQRALRPDSVERRCPGDPLRESDLAADPVFAAQFATLRHLERTHVAAGSDLAPLWRAAVTHGSLLAWLQQSDEVADSLKGRRDLVKKRRRGILRWLEGPDKGMPFHLPSHFVHPDQGSDRELRLFRLRDELEYIVIPFYRQVDRFAPGPRPMRDTLTHPLVRAILDWKASHLDAWLSIYPHLIEGRIYYPIPREAREKLTARSRSQGKRVAQPREFLTEVRFDTVRFMAWYYGNMN